MNEPGSALIIGGGMGTAAVGAIIWAVRMLLQRFVDQIDKGFAEIRANLMALSGEVHRKRWSTSNMAMNEADRAEYLNKCIDVWSKWTGVNVVTLRFEAERQQ